MKLRAILFAVCVAACGQAQPPAAEAPTTTEAASEGDTVGGETIQGPFAAMSNTAMGITGDMSITNETVSFMNGILLRTAHAETYSAYDPMNVSGELFDAAAPGDESRTVDVRRVSAQEITDDERSQGGLCGRGNPPSYVALVSDSPITTISIIAYTGADAPGRNATNSQVCAVFAYSSTE